MQSFLVTLQARSQYIWLFMLILHGQTAVIENSPDDPEYLILKREIGSAIRQEDQSIIPRPPDRYRCSSSRIRQFAGSGRRQGASPGSEPISVEGQLHCRVRCCPREQARCYRRQLWRYHGTMLCFEDIRVPTGSRGSGLLTQGP